MKYLNLSSADSRRANADFPINKGTTEMLKPEFSSVYMGFVMSCMRSSCKNLGMDIFDCQTDLGKYLLSGEI